MSWVHRVRDILFMASAEEEKELGEDHFCYFLSLSCVVPLV